MRQEDQATRVIRQLNSENEQIIIDAVEEIREIGTPVVFDRLLNVLLKPVSCKVQDSIFLLLCDLKNQQCAEMLVNAAASGDYDSVKKQLIISMWQNGLDYCSHLPFFVDQILTADFEIGFEALTVIDEMVGKFESGIIEEQLSKVARFEMEFPNSNNKLIEPLRNSLLSIAHSMDD